MLICVISVHVKLHKIRNSVFNNRKYLMFKKLNKQVSIDVTTIILLTCAHSPYINTQNSRINYTSNFF
jgi:hypothetical protein